MSVTDTCKQAYMCPVIDVFSYTLHVKELSSTCKLVITLSSLLFSLKDTSHGKQSDGVTPNDVIGDIFVGMDTLYNKDAIVLRSGRIAAPHAHTHTHTHAHTKINYSS